MKTLWYSLACLSLVTLFLFAPTLDLHDRVMWFLTVVAMFLLPPTGRAIVYFWGRVEAEATRKQREAEWKRECDERARKDDEEKAEADRLMTEAISFGFEPEWNLSFLMILGVVISDLEGDYADIDGKCIQQIVKFTRSKELDSPFYTPLFEGNISWSSHTSTDQGEIAYWSGYNARRDACIERGRMLKEREIDGEPSAILEGWL